MIEITSESNFIPGEFIRRVLALSSVIILIRDINTLPNL